MIVVFPLVSRTTSLSFQEFQIITVGWRIHVLSCAGNDTNSEQLSSRLLSLRRLFSVLFCFNVRKENKYFKPSIISSSWWKQVQVILNTFRLFQEYSYFDCSGKVSVCKTVRFNSSQEMLNETWNRPITYRKSTYFRFILHCIFWTFHRSQTIFLRHLTLFQQHGSHTTSS